jgi:hypothetical protein
MAYLWDRISILFEALILDFFTPRTVFLDS